MNDTKPLTALSEVERYAMLKELADVVVGMASTIGYNVDPPDIELRGFKDNDVVKFSKCYVILGTFKHKELLRNRYGTCFIVFQKIGSTFTQTGTCFDVFAAAKHALSILLEDTVTKWTHSEVLKKYQEEADKPLKALDVKPSS